jgi:hypothetical protein
MPDPRSRLGALKWIARQGPKRKTWDITPQYTAVEVENEGLADRKLILLGSRLRRGPVSGPGKQKKLDPIALMDLPRLAMATTRANQLERKGNKVVKVLIQGDGRSKRLGCNMRRTKKGPPILVGNSIDNSDKHELLQSSMSFRSTFVSRKTQPPWDYRLPPLAFLPLAPPAAALWLTPWLPSFRIS